MSGGIVDRRVGDTQDSGVSADDLDMSVEARARRMGWYPKDEFHGRPDDWIPAEKFVDRSERELPILRENLRRFDTRAAQAERAAQESQRRITDMTAKIELLSDAMDSMRSMADGAEKRGYDRAIATLRKDAQEAAAEGDAVRAAAVIDQMVELTNARKPVDGKKVVDAKTTNEPAVQNQQQQVAVDPVETAWMSDGSRTWFRDDAKLRKEANEIYGQILSSAEGRTRSKIDILAEVEERVSKANPNSQYFFNQGDTSGQRGGRTAKVSDGGDISNQSGGGGNKLSKAFDALKPEEKAEFNKVFRAAELRKDKPGYKPYTKAEFLRRFHGETEE